MAFFSKLSKCISAVFGRTATTPAGVQKPDQRPVRQKTAKTKTSPPAKTAPGKKRKKEKQSVRQEVSGANHQAKIIPPKPAQLKDIPHEDGKIRFLDLPLHEDLQYALQDMGFEYCTPIQGQSLPLLLQEKDVAGKAQTGTGKTAAFLLALFQRILTSNADEKRENGACRAVILAPTRELAIQIHKDAENIAKYTSLHNVVVFGGMDFEKQKNELNTPIDLLIGTPGRVIDYARRGMLKMRNADFLVLDEADRMLDMGFIPDVRRIVGMMPPKTERQTLLFSATLSPEIMHLASQFQREDAVTVESEPDSVVGENIQQKFYSVSISEKLPMLCHAIQSESFDRMLIFGNRKDHNLNIQYELSRRGIQCDLLSGDIPQQKRLKILENFRSGATRILIATDVAARGIHVDDVNIVVNYDLPEQAEDYVHRIGRTGRAGNKGKSISFVCEYGAYTMPAIEKLLNCEFKSELPDENMLQLPPPVAGSTLPQHQRNKQTNRGGRRNNGSRNYNNRRRAG